MSLGEPIVKLRQGFGGSLATIIDHKKRATEKQRWEKMFAKKQLKAYLKGATVFRTYPRGTAELPTYHPVPKIFTEV